MPSQSQRGLLPDLGAASRRGQNQAYQPPLRLWLVRTFWSRHAVPVSRPFWHTVNILFFSLTPFARGWAWLGPPHRRVDAPNPVRHEAAVHLRTPALKSGAAPCISRAVCCQASEWVSSSPIITIRHPAREEPNLPVLRTPTNAT